MQMHAVSPRWRHRAPEKIVRHEVRLRQIIAELGILNK
jgi:hypothetical protein